MEILGRLRQTPGVLDEDVDELEKMTTPFIGPACDRRDCTSARVQVRQAAKIIRKLLASAQPHPISHPFMYKAWMEAREALGILDTD